MKLISLVLVGLLLSSCNGIDGQFEAFENMVLKYKKKEISIPAGTYEAKIRNYKGKKLKLKIKGINKDNNFNFKIPKDAKIPRDNGTFTLSADQVQQPYDIAGRVTTERTMSERRRDRESCTYQEPYTVCSPNGRGGTTCSTHYRTIHGYRSVEYRLQTTVRNIFVELLTPASILINSTFNGTGTYYDRIYSYTGYCR